MGWCDINEVGDNPRTFVELHKNHDPRFLIGLGRMLRNNPRENRTFACRLGRLIVHRTAVGTYGCWWVAKDAAIATTLDQKFLTVDAFPKEGVVEVGNRGTDGGHSARSWRRVDWRTTPSAMSASMSLCSKPISLMMSTVSWPTMSGGPAMRVGVSENVHICPN